EQFNQSTVDSTYSSIYQGIRYAGYNLGLIPATLFAVRYISNRKEAISAGVLAGVIGIVPALFIFTSLFCSIEVMSTTKIPTLVLLDKLELSILYLLYNVVMLMTLVETGIGL